MLCLYPCPLSLLFPRLGVCVGYGCRQPISYQKRRISIPLWAPGPSPSVSASMSGDDGDATWHELPMGRRGELPAGLAPRSLSQNRLPACQELVPVLFLSLSLSLSLPPVDRNAFFYSRSAQILLAHAGKMRSVESIVRPLSDPRNFTLALAAPLRAHVSNGTGLATASPCLAYLPSDKPCVSAAPPRAQTDYFSFLCWV
ncbi:hypothetical protein B0T24DRAFT_372921 [Lasiosphaeria ovina]|uniref:Uncharacterized protein n=1 Tax=Lasiosphaeria ovina TaxID=92902 RepID=A0AAE0N2E9_9PEZI|nr:hypothetical protein B0T24DRAFT_372921 [Lasiosphaeria ovina]